MTKFFHHFEEDKKDYFFYEYCDGGDLTKLKDKQPNKRFTEASAKTLIRQLSYCVNEMHRMKLVHRDIKPDNVFIGGGKPFEVRLGDLGTARDINESNEFKLEVNESINTTTVGSGHF